MTRAKLPLEMKTFQHVSFRGEPSGSFLKEPVESWQLPERC